MKPYTMVFETNAGKKAVQIENADLKCLREPVDLVVCSAFRDDYMPVPNTLIGSLQEDFGISVEELSGHPALDMKESGVWISEETGNEMIRRIACLEIRDAPWGEMPSAFELKTRFDALFLAIRVLAIKDIPISTVIMPVLGTGDQGIGFLDSFHPLLTECISCLHQVNTVRRIVLISRDEENCRSAVDAVSRLDGEYGSKSAFISYSHRNQDIADIIASGLREHGIKPWVDHEMIRKPDYADAIVQGIRKADIFLFLVSEYSLNSQDCLREVRNAAKVSDKGRLAIMPVILRPCEFPAGFAYYLTGLDCLDISQPPVEEKAAELHKSIWRKFEE